MMRDAGLPCNVFSARAVGGMPEVEETEATFEGNARLKAEALRRHVPPDAYVLADDSGLAVDALNGAPGVCSARYAGVDADDQANNDLLLLELASCSMAERGAAFHCCLAFIHPDGRCQYFRGECRGWILDSPRGETGFGYDPLFLPDGYTQTFAELGAGIKNDISHRAQALAALKVQIAELTV